MILWKAAVADVIPNGITLNSQIPFPDPVKKAVVFLLTGLTGTCK